MGKGEIARYEQFLLCPQCFQKACFPGVIVWEWVNSLINKRIIDLPEFKAYADNKMNANQNMKFVFLLFTTQSQLLTALKRKAFENSIFFFSHNVLNSSHNNLQVLSHTGIYFAVCQCFHFERV